MLSTDETTRGVTLLGFLLALEAAATVMQPAPTSRFIICPGHVRCPRRRSDADPSSLYLDIVNESGREIRSLIINPSSVNAWEEDVLGSETIERGEQTTINLGPKERHCSYTIQVVFADGTRHQQNVDLCRSGAIVVQDRGNDRRRSRPRGRRR